MNATENVVDLVEAMQRFAVADYAVFVLMLVLCSMIGIYFGYISPGKQDEDEYLMGGRNMQTIPIALSMVASAISGITLLGLPTEVYVYGTEIMWCLAGMMLFGVVYGTTILPVFYDLHLMTLYQYLQMRFDKRVRYLGSIFFTISLITWLPIVIYVPALAFNQVTGLNVHIITPAVCTICVFYTCVGGMKAVVWTDVLQTFAMLGCLVIVIVQGTYNLGGLSVVLKRAINSGRLRGPILTPDPLIRQTFWSATIGAFCGTMASCGVNQGMIQRYLALPSLREARKASWMFVVVGGLIVLFSGYCGLLIFATYYECDPVSTQLARAKDQLLPVLVMDTLGSYPGLPGLFVAGVFSAALSSLSTGLNAMAAVVVEDFWRALSKKKPSERAVNIVMRVVVVLSGVVCVALVFVVEKLGVVLQLSASLGSITSGPTLAVFVEALFLPWVNTTGCLAGAGGSLAFMMWVILGAQSAIATGTLTFPEKPVSVEGCTYLFNTTQAANSTLTLGGVSAPELPLWIFRISYSLYGPLGILVSLLIALPVSWFSRVNGEPHTCDYRLISPVVRRFLPQTKPPVHGADFKRTALDRSKVGVEDIASSKL